MSKTSLALSSLIAAIPGGFLAYLLVMAFLNHITDMQSMMLKALVGVALVGSVAAALSPIGILIFAGGSGTAKPKKEKKAKKSKKSEVVEEEADDDVLLDEDAGDKDFVAEDDDFGLDGDAAAEGDDFELDFDEEEK